MKLLLLASFLIQIMTLNVAMANSKKDEVLYNALTAAFPAAIQYPGHYTQEVSVANLQCTLSKNSKKYDCRAQDNDSKELIAKETGTLVKALNALKPGRITKKSIFATITFSSVNCSMNSERADNDGQRQLFECSFEE